MHRRSKSVRDSYQRRSFMAVNEAEHERWQADYLDAIKQALV